MIFVWLLALVPVSALLTYVLDVDPIWSFLVAVLAIFPLAEWIRRATEHMARIAGPAIGGLLNVTFGNIAELILALFVLQTGNTVAVKGQITGSIIGNGLLGLGIAIIAGSLAHRSLKFNAERSGILSSLLILSTIALIVPAVFDFTERSQLGDAARRAADESLSLGVSVVLIAVYIANLIYTLIARRDVFEREEAGVQSRQHDQAATASDNDGSSPERGNAWPLWRALAVLLGGTALIAFEAEIVSGALEETAGQIGVSTFFLGVVVLAIVGNAAEYLSAVSFARRGEMGMVLSITVGSSIQVALLTAPALVLLSPLFGHPMNLVFANPLELVAIAGVAFAVNAIAKDGETNWFEGALLLGAYAVLAIAFFFVTT